MKLRALAVFVSFLAAIGLSEVCLRTVNYRPSTMDPNMFVENANELLPYKLRPNYQGYCAGNAVNIDADGYRVVRPDFYELYSGPEPRPERTILLLGDSGIFGFGLSDRDTIASQLQRLARNQNLNFQIRNIGVNGYTSWNEYASCIDYLNKYTATDVLLLYMPNDLTFDNDYFGISKGKRASFDRGESKLPHVTRFLYSHFYLSYLISDSFKRAAAVLNSGIKDAQTESIFDEKGKQPAIDYSMQALEKILQICRARQMNFVVGIYRDVAYFDDRTGWLQYEEVIKRNLDQHGIKWFVAKAHIDGLKASEVRVAWNDPHPSPEAAGLIAEDILTGLTKTEAQRANR